jgi:hypothetical protein
MSQIFIHHLPLLSRVERLEIGERREVEDWGDNPGIDSSLWLELLRLFISVQSLSVSKKLVRPIVSALGQLIDGMAIEVLPALRSLSLEGLEPHGPVREAVKSFVAARQLSDRHIDIQGWNPPSTLHWTLIPYDSQRSKGKLKFDFAREVDEIIISESDQRSSRPLTIPEWNKSASEPGLTEMVIHCPQLPDWPVYIARQSGLRCVDVFEAIHDTYSLVLTTVERSIHQSRIRDIERQFPHSLESGATKPVRRRDLLEGETLFLGLDWRGADSRYPAGCWCLNTGPLLVE